MQWFLNLPDWLYGIFSIAFAVLIGVGGLLVTRKWISRLHLTASLNEIVSYYLSTVAIFYGVMLGLIAVSVWESYNDAKTAVAAEVGSLAALYRDVSGYPEPDRNTLQADLREYTRYEIDVAWPEHRRGVVNPGGIERLWLFQVKLQTFEPKTKGQEMLHLETLRAFDDLVQKRALKLDTVTSHLARPMWDFVILGAVLSFVVSRQRRRSHRIPGRRRHALQGRKADDLGRSGMRAPCVIRWPGHIKPGTVLDDIFASLDWVPTFVDIAGGPTGDGLKKQIEAGKYPGIVKTTLDGFDQRAYLEGKSDKSARDTFFYYTGATPSAVRYKNWKLYFSMAGACADCGLAGVQTYKWPLVDNIKRDPFEGSVGDEMKSLLGQGGALAGPVTAYLYDWNIIPLGQLLWLKELESYGPYPPMQDPETYNLTQVIQQVKNQRATSHAGD